MGSLEISKLKFSVFKNTKKMGLKVVYFFVSNPKNFLRSSDVPKVYMQLNSLVALEKCATIQKIAIFSLLGRF